MLFNCYLCQFVDPIPLQSQISTPWTRTIQIRQQKIEWGELKLKVELLQYEIVKLKTKTNAKI